MILGQMGFQDVHYQVIKKKYYYWLYPTTYVFVLIGIGMSQNQVYRENRSSYSEHEYEDQCISFCIDKNNQTYLYGVFDGHDGCKAAKFVSQVSNKNKFVLLL